ncbi:hypothetical protein Pint_03902 [Pistacia integerrima]|uniref:Uncharacterized protein n=1 Tax=Pistacia integerrima TaxID=434235 RepID=A0ACC0Z8J5_9ROSI|nr:hypothetical protein Pint_03902 [Pistacia integerrima]
MEKFTFVISRFATPHTCHLCCEFLTCTFPGGMKTTIEGRTSSGKSTLIQTLFRIVEPAAGQIVIDGIIISSIGQHHLLSRLSIIPQDPTMFEGTVLSNLYPLEEYTDDNLGATASVDTATDNLIQLTFRQHFTDCTVITIAHRITSVLDSDMVLLLNCGLVEEYDFPDKVAREQVIVFYTTCCRIQSQGKFQFLLLL